MQPTLNPRYSLALDGTELSVYDLDDLDGCGFPRDVAWYRVSGHVVDTFQADPNEGTGGSDEISFGFLATHAPDVAGALLADYGAPPMMDRAYLEAAAASTAAADLSVLLLANSRNATESTEDTRQAARLAWSRWLCSDMAREALAR